MENTNIDVTGREISIKKILSAPIDKVWQVWTSAEHIVNWWGPDGFTNTIHTMDVRLGGEWRLTMHGPDGKRFPNKSEFVEIIQNEKIVFQHFNPNYLATVIFNPEGNKTLMQWTMLFETAELFETVVKVFKADEGLKQNAEKLENYLLKIK